MKRSLMLCGACFTLALSTAQHKETPPADSQQITAPRPPVPAIPAAPAIPESDLHALSAPPPPPPPPAPPSLPPAPPPPAVPPVPPAPAKAPVDLEDATDEITINSTGYDISVRKINGKDMVVIKKGTQVKYIKMETWMANKKMYESKYGLLPPPPPPLLKTTL